MEKDILIQNLRTKVGEDDQKVISDKTFEGIADVYLPMFADDEKITDDSWTYPVAALKQYAGQKRHDDKAFAEKFKGEYTAQHQKDVEERIRAAAEKAVEDYKKEHPDVKVDDPKDKKTEPDAKSVEEQVAAAVQAAMAKLTGEDGAIGKSLKTVTDFISTQAEREKAAAVENVKSRLKQHLLALKADNEACIDDALGDLEYGENPSFDDMKQTAIDAYEKRYKRYYGDGGKPFGGKSSGGGSSTNLMEQHIKRVEAQVQDAKDYQSSIEFAK